MPARTVFISLVILLVLGLLLLLAFSGGGRAGTEGGGGQQQVGTTPDQLHRLTAVLYCAMDEPIARQVIAEAESAMGIRVQPLFDTEASKTTGLVNRLRAERSRPQADVFWSNEPYQTEQLARDGCLAAYAPATANDLPALARSPGHHWTMMTLKPRVVAVRPGSTLQLDPSWTWMQLATRPGYARRTAIANPQFGTTRGHFAQLWARSSPDDFRAWLSEIANAGMRIVDGNSVTVATVVRGEAELGWTDLDDVTVARERGEQVGLFLPADSAITPATVALVADGPNPEAGRKLVDFLVSERVEELMARSPMRLVPIRPALRARLFAESPPLWPEEVQHVRWDDLPNVPTVLDAMPPALDAAKQALLRG